MEKIIEGVSLDNQDKKEEGKPEVGVHPKDQAEALLAKPFLIPRNPIALNVRFILVVLLIDFGFATLLALLSVLRLDPGRGLFMMVAVLVLIKLIVLIGFLMRMAAKWTEHSYYLSERQLVHQRGITSHQEDTFDLDNIRQVHLYQDFFGRMFDYGHLELTITSAETSKHVRLNDLKDPKHYKGVFEQYIG
ncbi:MAG TPA: PH domain-containing protein [Candidatus Polarisedimenticolaceae bacterium]|nr:PH domain-containing protein [Candidatus Polarisedimenticolaceae bacterium]